MKATRLVGMLALALACGPAAADGPGAGSGGTLGAGMAGASGDGGNGGSAGAPAADAGLADDGGSGGAPDAGPPPLGPPRKLDLLLMIDNSISMSDKQAVLRTAVPDLVNRLVNPVCVDALGAPFPPPAPGAPCPEGQTREFDPVEDVNIGVISSSLGDVGANVACPSQGFPRYVPDRIDLAHLVGSLPRGAGTANTDAGFLAWRAGSTDLAAIEDDVQRMIQRVGENGCAWEASLESWYRFLIDPYPYQELVRVACPGSASSAPNCAQQATDAEGRILLDQTLLAQRAAFLRPDSMVAIVMLSDENDCSVQVGNQSWVVLAIDDSRPMFRGSSTCDTDPNAKCCYSCPLGPPPTCASDPICAGDGSSGVLENRLPAAADGQNLRCFQQKRRFGIDLLYPTQRYVNALQHAELCWNDPELATERCTPDGIVVNPLYAGGRTSSFVVLAGILGVPWQAIASDVDADGRPLPAGALRFRNATELLQHGVWEQIVGSPGVPWRAATGGRPEVASVPAIAPSLPQMVESEFARAGVVTGNAINGREHDTQSGPGGAPDDLQYACIFPLPAPRDCSALDPSINACDCYEGQLDRPLCEAVPGTSVPGTTQYWAKAYPASRQLEVLRRYGENSVVASICARNVSDGTGEDFGYRPAVAAIIERLKERLPR